MTTTDFTTNEIERPAEPGSIGAGAEIYRRMERRSKGRPMWMTAAPIAVLALAVAGGVVAYESTKHHATPAPVQAQATPAAAPRVAATTPLPARPAQVAQATPAAPVTRAVRPEHARPVIAPVAHRRTARDANAASSAGQDTSAFTPAPQRRVTAPTVAVRPGPAQSAAPEAAAPQPAAPVTHNFAPPSAMTAPAPVTVTPPPAPVIATPAAPSQP